MDPKIVEMLSTKSDTERMKAIAFSLACLCTGPTPYQPPDYCPRAARGKRNRGCTCMCMLLFNMMHACIPVDLSKQDIHSPKLLSVCVSCPPSSRCCLSVLAVSCHHVTCCLSVSSAIAFFLHS